MKKAKLRYKNLFREIVKEILKSADVNDRDGRVFVGNEQREFLHRDKKKYPIVTLFLCDDNSLKFMDYIIQKVSIDELWFGIRDEGVPDLFQDRDYNEKIERYDFLKKAKEALCKTDGRATIGLKLKIDDEYYYMSTTGEGHALIVEQFLFCILMSG